MLDSRSVQDAIQLYNRGLISRFAFEQEIDGLDRPAPKEQRSAFWQNGTVDLSQDQHGVWRDMSSRQ